MTRTGGPEVFEVLDRPDPVAGAGEVRIAVRAAGLNFADTMARVGLYPAAPKPPCVLGYEVAGEVETIGEGVSGLAVGQRVMAGTQFGGQAELAVARARDVLPMPDHFSFEEGAAFCVNYAHRVRRLDHHGRAAGAGPGVDPLRRRRRRDRGNPGRPQRRRGDDLRHRLGGQARGDHRSGRAPSDRLPHPGLQGRGAAADQRRGRRRDLGRHGSDLVPQGLPDPAARRPADHVRTVGGAQRERPQHQGHGVEPAADPDLDDALVERRPAAESESWRVRAQPAQLVEARGRHGPDHRTAAERPRQETPDAGRREVLPLRSGRRRPPLSRRTPQHRQGGPHSR